MDGDKFYRFEEACQAFPEYVAFAETLQRRKEDFVLLLQHIENCYKPCLCCFVFQSFHNRKVGRL